jgi:hypothetical protein
MRPFVTLYNTTFYGEELLAPCLTPKQEHVTKIFVRLRTSIILNINGSHNIFRFSDQLNLTTRKPHSGPISD